MASTETRPATEETSNSAGRTADERSPIVDETAGRPETGPRFSRILVAVNLLDWDPQLPPGSTDLKHVLGAASERGTHGTRTVILDHAIALARPFGSCIELVHVRPSHIHQALTGPFMSAEQFDEWIDDRLEELSEAIAHAGIVCVTTALKGSVAEQLRSHAIKTQSDLIILGTHMRAGPAHALLGGVTEHLVRSVQIPILVVPV